MKRGNFNGCLFTFDWENDSTEAAPSSDSPGQNQRLNASGSGISGMGSGLGFGFEMKKMKDLVWDLDSR